MILAKNKWVSIDRVIKFSIIPPGLVGVVYYMWILLELLKKMCYYFSKAMISKDKFLLR